MSSHGTADAATSPASIRCTIYQAASTGELIMAHTHEFDCRICGAHLDSQSDLDQHNRKEHTQNTQSSNSSTERSASSSSNNDLNQSNR